jgi:hypothetical protein
VPTAAPAAAKTAAAVPKLGLGRRRNRRDRSRNAERGKSRNYGLPDGNAHGEYLLNTDREIPRPALSAFHSTTMRE